MQNLFWISIAGALGALARYGLSALSQRLYNPGFPWGTALVNALGCLLFGVIWVLADEKLSVSPVARTVMLVGFMGAFTTFSSYIFETGEFLRSARWWLAAFNLLGQVIVGLAAMYLGITIARAL